MTKAKVVDFKVFKEFTSTVLRRINLASQAGKTYSGNRDLYAILGYKRTLEFNDFFDRYERGDIASRVVDALALATWRNPPVVKARGKHPAFAKAWQDLEERHSIFHYLERIDRLSGIGQYGVLLMGFSGGGDLSTPVKPGSKLIYLSPFHQGHAPLKDIIKIPTNPRFGLPESYLVDLGSVSTSNNNATLLKKEVHWTRVLHLAEGLNEDEIYGAPRLLKIWNKLDDLDKVVGGSSEAVWRTVDRGIQFDVDKDMDLDEGDEAAFTAEIEEYIHNVKRYIRTKGITANVLGGETADPTGIFKVLLGVISGTTGIPQRILLGSEVGQLASSQDERNFNSRIKERQKNYAGPRILQPFVERMISSGNLPAPKGGFTFEWPDLSIVSLKDKADVAARFGQAIVNVGKHLSETEQPIISEEEFREIFLDLFDELPPKRTPKVITQPSNKNEDVVGDPNAT